MKVFLGGTCGASRWREELIPQLECEYFNPVVKDWNEEAQKNEIYEREEGCDKVLYVLTPDMEGFYSIAEVVEDSIKRPDKTIFCVRFFEDYDKSFNVKQIKSLNAVIKLVERNGALVVDNFCNLSYIINSLNKG